MTRRPDRAEYDAYYHRYISLVPDGDIAVTLARELRQTRALLETVPAARESWAYEAGKWTFREVVGHLVDAERVFAGRALWIARDPDTALPSFEQNVWALNSNASFRPLRDLLDEWASVRAASLTLVRTLDAEAMLRAGTASGLRFTVRSLVWIIAGHELHHRKMLRERYGLEGSENGNDITGITFQV
jgi:uncharacterized damage-inducible protein DinB